MKTLLTFLTFLLMAGSAIGQTQGVSVRATNGFSYGTLTGQRIVATNFTGNGAGLTNIQDSALSTNVALLDATTNIWGGAQIMQELYADSFYATDWYGSLANASNVPPAAIMTTNQSGAMGQTNIGERLIFDGTRARWSFAAKDIFLNEEFMGSVNGTAFAQAFDLGWSQNPNSGAVSGNQNIAGHPGIGSLTANSVGDFPAIALNCIPQGSQSVFLQLYFLTPALSTGTDQYEFRMGLLSDYTATNQANGMWISYTTNDIYGSGSSANWGLVASATGVTNRVASSVAFPADTWVNIALEVNAGGTQSYMWINGTRAATNSTSIATRCLAPAVMLIKGTHAGNTIVYMDWANLAMNFTTARW